MGADHVFGCVQQGVDGTDELSHGVAVVGGHVHDGLDVRQLWYNTVCGQSTTVVWQYS